METYDLTEDQIKRFVKKEQMLYEAISELHRLVGKRGKYLEKIAKDVLEDAKVRNEIDFTDQKLDKYWDEILNGKKSGRKTN